MIITRFVTITKDKLKYDKKFSLRRITLFKKWSFLNIRSPVHQQLTLLAVIEIQLHDVTREGDASLDTGHTTGDLLTRLLTKNQSHSLERNHDPLHETCIWLIKTHCTDSTLFDVTFGHKPKLRLKWKGWDYSYIHCILLVMILIYYNVFNQ